MKKTILFLMFILTLPVYSQNLNPLISIQGGSWGIGSYGETRDIEIYNKSNVNILISSLYVYNATTGFFFYTKNSVDTLYPKQVYKTTITAPNGNSMLNYSWVIWVRYKNLNDNEIYAKIVKTTAGLIQTSEEFKEIETTSEISSIKSDVHQPSIYSINGMKLDTISKSGFYVIDGQKVFIKK